MEATTRIDAERACISLRGDFTIEHYRAFKEAVADLTDNEELREVSIDFSAVGFIDSSALGMLLLFRERLAGRSIRLFGVRGAVRAVLDVASFGRMFAIDEERQVAHA